MSSASAPPPRISVVAPVYNEVESLPQLVTELIDALEPRSESFELLLIDDGSDDGSDDLIRSLAADFPSVRAFRRERRAGQSAAVLTGILASRGEIVVTIDADLQNDPADIPLLLDRLTDYDVVGGIRAQRQDRWHRRIASRLANAIRRTVLGDSFRDVGCSLKAYRTAYLEELPAFDGLHRFLPVIVERRGARVCELPVSHRPRLFGASKYTVRARARRGLCDLFGVRWLEARAVDPSRAREIRREPAATPGTPRAEQG